MSGPIRFLKRIVRRFLDHHRVASAPSSNDAPTDPGQDNPLRDCMRYLKDKGVTVVAFATPTVQPTYPLSDNVLRRGRLGLSFPVMAEDPERYEGDLREIYQEKYSPEYIESLTYDNDVLFMRDHFCMKDVAKPLVNIRAGHRVTCFQPHEANRAVHIYGNCIVVGMGLEDGDTLPSQIQRLINESGIKNVRVYNHGIPSSLEYVLHNLIYDAETMSAGDIVVLMQTRESYVVLAKENIPLISLHNEWPINAITTSQFFDSPNHLGWKVMRILAETIAPHIIRLLNAPAPMPAKRKRDHPGLRNYMDLVFEDSIDPRLKATLDAILEQHPIVEGQTYGAVVMNADPFTMGHRRLIEAALREVDRLYVFIVSEDASTFSAADRLAMVQAGTRDLANVVVTPCGKAYASVETFPEYFARDKATPEYVDAGLDLQIFCGFIAPALNIGVRFAGSEPTDRVTQMFNGRMAQTLPAYGLEFREIPRFTSNDGHIYSALRVRQLLTEGRLEEVRGLVPDAVFDLLIQSQGPRLRSDEKRDL